MKCRKHTFLLPLLAILFSCQHHVSAKASTDPKLYNSQLMDDAKAVIHTGDVVLRSGRDFTSYRIRELSHTDKTYSHAGIAVAENAQVYIYHITPPDMGEPAADTAMRRETIEQFADPARCFGFGIVRYNLDKQEQANAAVYVDSLYRQKISFDHFFDLHDAHKMYCSEMVRNTLEHASSGRIQIKEKYFTPVQAMKAAAYFHLSLAEVTKRPYISIDAVELNAHATIVQQYVFLK